MSWLAWQRNEAKKWDEVAQAFKDTYKELAEPERTGTVETHFCPDCKCYVQAELVRDGIDFEGDFISHFECLECGANLNL